MVGGGFRKGQGKVATVSKQGALRRSPSFGWRSCDLKIGEWQRVCRGLPVESVVLYGVYYN